jgi:nitrite reductase/ring-hydroxylating ferredoxin subunit
MAAADLPDGKPVRQMLGEVPVVAIQTNSTVHVLADRCSHMSGPLSGGELADGCLTCPWHGSAFRIVDGVSGPRPCDGATACLRGPRGWRRDPGLPAGRRLTSIRPAVPATGG